MPLVAREPNWPRFRAGIGTFGGYHQVAERS